MMYFFDSYAILEIIDGNPSYNKFKEETITTTVMNLGEVYFSLLRRFNQQTADYWLKILHVQLLEISLPIMRESMLFKYDHKKQKISMVDSIGYVVAQKHNLLFLTGDNAFEKIHGVTFVK